MATPYVRAAAVNVPVPGVVARGALRSSGWTGRSFLARKLETCGPVVATPGEVRPEGTLAQRMADPAYQAQQWERRYDPNIEDVNRFVDALDEQRPGRGLPYIDPAHDVDECRIVSLFASPGPEVSSGFVSAQNDDAGGRRAAGIYAEVGLRAAHVMPWNVYPWYLPGKRDKALTPEQIDEGLKPLLGFLQKVSRASALVAHGADAHKLARRLLRLENRAIRRRGFKVYEVRSTADRAYAGPQARQDALQQQTLEAYRDAMGRAGIRSLMPPEPALTNSDGR